MSRSTRSYYGCLVGAVLLLVLAVVLPLWTLPTLLHRPGIPAGPLLICGAWGVLLTVYGWRQTR